MAEKEQLINKLKYLIKINTIKQKNIKRKNNLGPEVGCITRESFEILKLYPKMQSLGITLDDLSQCGD